MRQNRGRSYSTSNARVGRGNGYSGINNYGINGGISWLMVGVLLVISCVVTYLYTVRHATCMGVSSIGGCRDIGVTNENGIGTANGDDIVIGASGPSRFSVGQPTRPNVQTQTPVSSDLRASYGIRTPSVHAGGMSMVPVNVRTSGMPTSYAQHGFLSNGKENIIPLYGRNIHRDKWQYYTMSDKYNSIQLPISVRGKNASSEYGCEELTNGDTVYVEGYNMPFRVTLYEKEGVQYIPYL